MAHCPHCGAATNPGASFCAACGTTLAPPTPTQTPSMAPVATPTTPAPAAPHARPLGVTIVSIAMIALAAFSVIGIIFALFIALVLGAAFSEAFGATPWFGWVAAGAGLAAAIMMIFLLFALAFAAVGIATGVGGLRGAPWAWVATLVVMGLVALNSLSSLAARDMGGVLGLAAAGFVIWYYFRPEVKAWFKRA